MYNSEKDKITRLKHNKKIINKFYNLKVIPEEIPYYNMIKEEIDKYIENKEYF